MSVGARARRDPERQRHLQDASVLLLADLFADTKRRRQAGEERSRAIRGRASICRHFYLSASRRLRALAERGPIGSGWNGPSRISREALTPCVRCTSKSFSRN